MKKYAFIDRDGTLIYEPQDTYYVSPDKFRILPGVIEVLLKLSEADFKLVMVTNQDNLGSDKNPREAFNIVQYKLADILNQSGVTFDEILICPHGPEDDCACRKPKLGLVQHIKDLDKSLSIVIGDRQTDMEFARNLGIKGIKLEVNKGMKGIKL